MDAPTKTRPTLDDIRTAAERIKGSVIRTPMMLSRTLSEIADAEIWLKFENLQFTAAYKERGALNKLLQLSDEERKRGVIAASAGNHAQAVAYHGRRLGIPVTIVMPNPTPSVKVTQTESHGARVVLHGDLFDDAYIRARELEAEQGLVFVHPFDDPQIIAGAGTMALEMLEAVPKHGVGTFARMQGDVLSMAMREALPGLLQTRPKSAEARQALDSLRKWDGAMHAGRSEPLIAWAWWREFSRVLYSDELGDAFRTQWSPRAVFVANVLARAGDHERWCDNVRTAPVETCDDLLADSLESALADLRKLFDDKTRKLVVHFTVWENKGCGYCDGSFAIFDDFASRNAGKATFVRVAAEYNDPMWRDPWLTKNAPMKGIPTFITYYDQSEVARVDGRLSAAVLNARLLPAL